MNEIGTAGPKREEQLAELLGLEPTIHYAEKHKWGRQCGRTTRMLLHALARLEAGQKVKINAHSAMYAMELYRKVKFHAYSLGISADNLIPGTSFKIQDDRPYHGSDVVLINDHFDVQEAK